MPLEIVSRGPDTELDRKIAMLAEVLGCTVEEVVYAASHVHTLNSCDDIASLMVRFLYRVYNELARHTPNRVSLS